MNLHVNIDHVATLRQARGTRYPDPVWAAALCELAGAHGITIHLREDRRHISDRDVRLLRQTVRSKLNLEMAATDEMVGIALEVLPDLVTLVPEKREERTTEGGLDVVTPSDGLRRACQRLGAAGIPVALFVDPTREAVKATHALGAPALELHTGDYCEATAARAAVELDRLAVAAEDAAALGLHVAAGHGLDYPNVRPVALLPGIAELNIGHSIIARAVMVGLEQAVRDMLAILREGERVA
ncbi:MAG: pyridoxine 5'-phosphate synthase [Deltaproteobacteria bacterium]|nr:pyridoxine 5'-phosphate synthase [Deltaproteobacteria bacterium]